MKRSLVDVAFASEKRKQVLLLLKDGAKGMEDLLKPLRSNRQSLLPQMKILEEHYLVDHYDDTYELTATGKLIVDKMLPLLSTLEDLEVDIDYWGTHKIDLIPYHLLKRLDELERCMVISPSIVEAYEENNDFYEASKNSRSLFGVTTFFYPKYDVLFSELTSRNVNINFIITQDLLDNLRTNRSAIFLELLSSNMFHLYVYPKEMGFLSFSYNDYYTKIRFLKNDGDFDNKFLLCSTPKPFKWAKEMFDHYMKDSIPVTEI
jgi:predicted transcriptional regulator